MASLGHIPLNSKLEMKYSPIDIPRTNPRPLVKLPSLGGLFFAAKQEEKRIMSNTSHVAGDYAVKPSLGAMECFCSRIECSEHI